MNLPDLFLQERIDSLTRSQMSFALYRLAWTDVCYMVLQNSGEVSLLNNPEDLNGKRGFVMAPFETGGKHPLVLIHPQEVACGWDEIEQAVMQVDAKNLPEKPVHKVESDEEELPERPLMEDFESYEQAFDRFIAPLESREFKKIVLSRKATRELPEKFSPIKTFYEACNQYPRMFIYLVHTPETGTWLGSTPEALLRGTDDKWRTVALAGTQPIVNEVVPTEWNGKNREEQAMVTNYIRNVLNKYAKKVKEEGPYTARAGQLVHLKTDFSCVLKNNEHLGELLQALHPTPAVCGLPKKETADFILEHEGYDRKYYSGFVGWLDPSGCTDLYVNLRCMELTEKEATLYAGGGILPSSTCDSEWEETRHKIETMNRLL